MSELCSLVEFCYFGATLEIMLCDSTDCVWYQQRRYSTIFIDRARFNVHTRNHPESQSSETKYERVSYIPPIRRILAARKRLSNNKIA